MPSLEAVKAANRTCLAAAAAAARKEDGNEYTGLESGSATVPALPKGVIRA